ncbi:MAG: methionine gamma-lyase family protein, partial [Eubacterium sp.]|nr:methionine gamma-lyase family protein [Eubacterium sp.]
MNNIYASFGISDRVLSLADCALAKLSDRFADIDDVADHCTLKVIAAMQANRVSESDLPGSTGYGYNDSGRDNLERVYASLFHTESALVRSQITCGTHALNIALSAILRPGDELLSPVGKPYDTLENVIGINGAG